MLPRRADTATRKHMARNGLTRCRTAETRHSTKRWCGGGHGMVRHGPFTTRFFPDTVRHGFVRRGATWYLRVWPGMVRHSSWQTWPDTVRHTDEELRGLWGQGVGE